MVFFFSSTFDVRAWICNQNAIFTRLARTQINTDHYRFSYVFLAKTDIRPAWWGITMRNTPIMPQNLFDHVLMWGHMTNLKQNISSSARSIATRPGRVVAYDDVTWPSDYVVTWSHVTNWRLNISSSKRSMISKLCRVVTYDEGNSPIMRHDSLTA